MNTNKYEENSEAELYNPVLARNGDYLKELILRNADVYLKAYGSVVITRKKLEMHRKGWFTSGQMSFLFTVITSLIMLSPLIANERD